MNAKVNLVKTSGAPRPAKASLTESAEFMVFQLDEREYAIDIRQVQRLRGYRSLTRIANGPDFVEGVAISDGVIMPIVDMRLHVNIAKPTFNHFTVVIIAKVLDRTVGLVVDSVSDVIRLTAGEVKPVSDLDLASTPGADSLTGVATYRGRNLILLDIQKLMRDTGIKESEKMKA